MATSAVSSSSSAPIASPSSAMSVSSSAPAASSGQVVVLHGPASRRIPKVILVHLFTFLPGKDFVSASAVSMAWHSAYQWTLDKPLLAMSRLRRDFLHYRIPGNLPEPSRQYQRDVCQVANLQNGVFTTVTLQQHDMHGHGIQTADGLLVTGSITGIIRIWDPNSGKCLRVLKGHNAENLQLLETSAGLIVSGSNNGALEIWNPTTGECLHTLIAHTESVEQILETTTGLIISRSNESVKIWNPMTGKCLHTIVEDLAWVSNILDISDGQIVMELTNNRLKIWDSATGQCLHTLVGHTNGISEIIKTSARQIVSGCANGVLKIWDPATGQCLRTIVAHTDEITEILETSAGQIVSGSRNGTLRIWDPATGKCLRSLVGHTHYIYQVLETSTGQIVSMSWNNTIKIWDPATGKCLHTLADEEEHINQILEISTGQIISLSGNGTLKIWDPATGQCLQTIDTHINNCMGRFHETPTGQIIVYCKFYGNKVVILDFASSPQQLLMRAARRLARNEVDLAKHDLDHLPRGLREVVTTYCPGDFSSLVKIRERSGVIFGLAKRLQGISTRFGLPLFSDSVAETARVLTEQGVNLNPPAPVVELDEKDQSSQVLLEQLRQAVESDNDKWIGELLEVFEKRYPASLSTVYRNLCTVHSEQGLIKKRHDHYGRIVFNNGAEAPNLCKDLSKLKAARLQAIERTLAIGRTLKEKAPKPAKPLRTTRIPTRPQDEA